LEVRKDFGKNRERIFYEFGPFRLDVREQLLRRDGELVPLTPKLFDILLVLILNSGHILTKDEMIKMVWSDTAVEESNLARNVSSLRKALGERPTENQYIETIPWRGYRFVAELKEFRGEAAAIDSLAVLPFLNESADPNSEYLSDGITDSLINKLSLLSNLKVMSRNSVFQYKGQDVLTVGRELGVRAVLTGRVKQVDGVLIVSVELVDAFDSRHLWGAQYNREFADIFSMQETISREIVERLRVQLMGDEKQRLAKSHTDDTEAYESYLKGRYFWNKLTVEGFRKAIQYFEQAIDKDSRFALAYVGLGTCQGLLGNPAEARKSKLKALELDPTLGEVHTSLGIGKFLGWDFSGADKEFQLALKLNPNYAEGHHWYAIFLANMGRHDEAAREANRARELDPVSLLMNQTAGNVFMLAHDYGRAVEALQKTLELDANFAAAHSVLGCVYAHKGMCDEAIAEFEKVRTLAGANPQVDGSIKALMGYAYAAGGKRNEALKIIEELSSPHDALAYSIAAVYAALYEIERAFEWLSKAFQTHTFQLVSLKVDPAFDNIRSDPRFQDLLQRIGLSGGKLQIRRN
jgi:TolB-like protein/Flp pilus assembly protein TadD